MRRSHPHESPRRLCINCDNRHGCRTAQPPCIDINRVRKERRLTGKQLMGQRGLLGQCHQCGLFRQCWTEEDYRRSLLPRGHKGRW